MYVSKGGLAVLTIFSTRTLNPFGLGHKDSMTTRQPVENFSCPKCGAHYKLVRMPAPAHSRNLALHCKICHQEFASSDDGNIFKYFLMGSARASSRQAGQSRHSSRSSPSQT